MIKENPRLVFFGTPEFAVASLDALVASGFDIAGVVTAPDKPAGRGLSLAEPAVKKYALACGLPFFQPTNLKSPDFLQTLAELKPDLQVVVAFRMLPREVWEMPSLGTFNLHASLLPQYRGAAPINHAIINGETETGVTTFFINEKIDTGAILLQTRTGIRPDETAGQLHDKLMKDGAQLVIETVKRITEGTISPVDQTEIVPRAVSLKPAPKIYSKNTIIDWNREVDKVYNQIRGLTPFPGSFSEIRMKDGSHLRIKIVSAQIDKSPVSSFSPGMVTTDRKRFLKISAVHGAILIHSLQPAARKLMNIGEFLNGFGSKLA